MVWGIAISGIFVTYGAATPWPTALSGVSWLTGLLWLPWVLAASYVTDRLWTGTAVTLDLDREGSRGWLPAVGFTALFFAIAGAVWLVANGTGVAMGADAWMLSATGLLTIAVGLVDRSRRLPGSTQAIGGGVVLLAVAVGLTIAGPEPAVAGLLPAAAVGAVYIAIGARTLARG